MANSEPAKKAETVIAATIDELLKRRGANGVVVRPESRFLGDLDMDSLEMAELASELEDEVGHEPFSDGIIPDTVRELVGFYESDAQGA
jgi:acyl carrier protein